MYCNWKTLFVYLFYFFYRQYYTVIFITIFSFLNSAPTHTDKIIIHRSVRQKSLLYCLSRYIFQQGASRSLFMPDIKHCTHLKYTQGNIVIFFLQLSALYEECVRNNCPVKRLVHLSSTLLLFCTYIFCLLLCIYISVQFYTVVIIEYTYWKG